MTDAQRIAELEAELAVVTADNAAFLVRMKYDCYDKYGYCLLCEAQKPAHNSSCITQAEHPGRRLLERLEAAERLKIVAQKIQDEILPRDIFVGCDDCVNEACECDRGIQITRQLTEALAAYDKVKEPSE